MKSASGLTSLAICILLAACQQAEQENPGAPSEIVVSQSRVDPADLVDCAATGRPTTEFDCNRAVRAEAEVREGVAAIEWPRDLQRGRERTIYLTVGNAQPARPGIEAGTVEEPGSAAGDVDAPDVGEAPTAESPPPRPDDPEPEIPDRETVAYTPLVGRFMSAELTGPGFEISPSGPVSQELPPDSSITWAWTVKPLRKGIQRLTVTTRVEFVDSSGDRVPLRASTQRKDVEVTVSPVDQVREWLTDWPGWLKLIGGVFTALAGTLAAWFGLRRVIRNRGEPDKPADGA